MDCYNTNKYFNFSSETRNKEMNVSFQSGQERFLACSKGLEIILLIWVIILSTFRIIGVIINKQIDCQEQLVLQYTEIANKTLKQQKSAEQEQYQQQQQEQEQEQEPPKQGEQIQNKKPIPLSQKSLSFKVLHRIQMLIKQFSFLGIVILNIICFTSYEYLLISTTIYLLLTLLRLETLIKPKNMYLYMLLERIPNLFVVSWFINLLAIPNTDIFNI